MRIIRAACLLMLALLAACKPLPPPTEPLPPETIAKAKQQKRIAAQRKAAEAAASQGKVQRISDRIRIVTTDQRSFDLHTPRNWRFVTGSVGSDLTSMHSRFTDHANKGYGSAYHAAETTRIGRTRTYSATFIVDERYAFSVELDLATDQHPLVYVVATEPPFDPREDLAPAVYSRGGRQVVPIAPGTTRSPSASPAKARKHRGVGKKRVAPPLPCPCVCDLNAAPERQP